MTLKKSFRESVILSRFIYTIRKTIMIKVTTTIRVFILQLVSIITFLAMILWPVASLPPFGILPPRPPPPPPPIPTYGSITMTSPAYSVWPFIPSGVYPGGVCDVFGLVHVVDPGLVGWKSFGWVMVQ